MPPGRLELPTCGLGNRRSIHLSYGGDLTTSQCRRRRKVIGNAKGLTPRSEVSPSPAAPDDQGLRGFAVRALPPLDAPPEELPALPADPLDPLEYPPAEAFAEPPV